MEAQNIAIISLMHGCNSRVVFMDCYEGGGNITLEISRCQELREVFFTAEPPKLQIVANKVFVDFTPQDIAEMEGVYDWTVFNTAGEIVGVGKLKIVKKADWI